ncbi:hypothetical protein HNV08_09300 [Winogradskyella eckloniae]|uniref:hypothetical protein n=1 Tax=Winogradskyella eckloniae TaxID=1089306 RepID=UPI001567C0D3|nr:hypothetical protein [Winogradskyella eckloniae]NRD20243.1 hypothetical protein [Winogradskyella eckloniae]
MKNATGKIFKNPTIFSILGIILILVGLPFGINGLTLNGGGSLGGAIILFGVLIVGLIVILDRILAHKANTKIINRIEITILIIGITIFSFTKREIIIDLSDENTDYFVVLENNGTLKNSELDYSFPFNKKMEFKDKVGIINSIADNYQRIELESPHNWKSKRIQPWKMNDFKIRFYSNGDLKLTDKEVDSIINKEIKTLPNNSYK